MAAGELSAYLDGEPVGAFAMSASGKSTFTYLADYLSRKNPTPLSLSMPVRSAAHRSRCAEPFLQGLLPDSEERLAGLSARYHTGRNPFALLTHVGRDAAGAIQLLPPGESPSDGLPPGNDVSPLSDDDFEAIMSDLARNPGSWGRLSKGRWSLAGAQSKVALYRLDDGRWAVPQGSTPTTYILKPALEELPDHDVNEYVTMSAARLLGLKVAGHELIRTSGGVRVFAARRYDREQRDGKWVRLHQEDLCQAMSVYPSKKYQADGGPSVPQIARLFQDNVGDIRERETVCRAFFDALVFNSSALNTDAHAKNYSLMLQGTSVELAPLYDLGSFAAYTSRSSLAPTSAMKIGDEYRFSAIGEPQFLSAAKALSIDAPEAIQRVRHITGNIAEAFDAAARTVEEPFARTLAASVAAHADRRGWTAVRNQRKGTMPQSDGTVRRGELGMGGTPAGGTAGSFAEKTGTRPRGRLRPSQD